MPSLPCPPLLDGVPLDGGDLPVSALEDVEQEWATELQPDPTQQAPILQAIQTGQQALLLEYQRAASYAAAQSDIGRATEEYEDELFDERGVYRQTSESDDAYRARGLARPGVVDPNDIIAAANAVLAPYTSISCRYAEESDGWFVFESDASTPFAVCYDPRLGGLSEHRTPFYPDRLYLDAVAPGTPYIANRQPSGLQVNTDEQGHWFLLRAPDISLLDTEILPVYTPPAVGITPADGWFIDEGGPTTDLDVEYVFNFSSTVNDVYNALIGAVNNIVGMGIRWSLYVDPFLNS